MKPMIVALVGLLLLAGCSGKSAVDVAPVDPAAEELAKLQEQMESLKEERDALWGKANR